MPEFGPSIALTAEGEMRAALGLILALGVVVAAAAAEPRAGDHRDMVNFLFAAINEKDVAKRDSLIARAFSDGAILSDQGERAEGGKAIGKRIDLLQRNQPGLRYQPIGAVDRQHDALRVAYEVVDDTGTTAFEGLIFALVGNDGRLVRVDLFTGPSGSALP